MKDLKPENFTIGEQITIDNPHDDLEPHTLTICAVDVLMAGGEGRRSAFAVTFFGSPMIDSRGEQVLQGCFTIQGGTLNGEEVFLSVNGYAPNDVESFEYEAIFA